MATKSDLQTAAINWNKRAVQAHQAGIPRAAWQPLMQKDLQSVMQGKSPMQDREVADAIRSAVGMSPIKDPGKGVSGIMDVLGNVPSDIQNIVTGFVPGTVGYVTSLPEQARQMYRLFGMEGQQKQLETGKQLGMDFSDTSPVTMLRNLPKLPVLGPLVPGATTAANLTTSEGRKQIEAHPVSTVLDVGAAVSAAGKAGLFGSAAAKEADIATEAAKAAGEEPPVPGAKAALQKGEPYRAAGRSAMTAAEKLSGGRVSRQMMEQWMIDHAVHPILARKVAKPKAELEETAQLDLQDFVKRDLFDQYRKQSPEDQQLIQQAVTRGDKTILNERPELAAIAEGVRGVQNEAARKAGMIDITTPWGKHVYYHPSHPVAKAFAAATKLGEEAKRAEEELGNARELYQNRLAKEGGESRRTIAAYNRLQSKLQKYEKAGKAADEAGKTFHDNFNNYSPAPFWRILSDRYRTAAKSFAEERFAHNQASLDMVLNKIEGAETWNDMYDAIGKQEAQRLRRETEATWTTIAKDEGLDPVYLPNTHVSKISHVMNTSIVPDARYITAFSNRNTMFNLSNSVDDVLVGVTASHRDALVMAAQRTYVNKYIKPFAVNQTDHRFAVQDAIRNGGPTTVDVRLQASDEINRNMVKWSPEDYGMAEAFPTGEGQEWLLPKGVQKSLDYLGFTRSNPAGPLKSMSHTGMKVWRFSIMSTPRHLSHITLGGMMMGTLQDPLFAVHLAKQLRSALTIIKSDKDPHARNELIAKFGGKNVHDFGDDQLHLTTGAKSWGRMALTHPFDTLRRFEEGTVLMYKVTTMLTQEAKGIQRDEAINIANKWFVDRNSWTPFERATMGKIFPFYGFTRHLFRYLMTYPSDHPIAASILTNFANQHEADWNSGLPRNLSFLFYLGAPDTNGNITAVDYRSIDPFRSFYNDFTLAGFWSQVNPALQFVAQASGINILSGTPELYPSTHYDPSTGQMVADKPSNLPLKALEALIPETTAVEAQFQLTDQFRNLKLSDPAAYKSRLYSSLGLPFAPIQFNVPLKEQTAQMKRYRDAQTSIDQAIQSGDFSKAKRYDYVPVPSLLSRYLGNATYATPGQIEAIYNALRQRMNAGDTSLHAILPKPSRRRTG